MDEDVRVVDLLVALGEGGLASGIHENFDIDAFIDEEDEAQAAA